MECSSLCRCYSLKIYGKCKNTLWRIHSARKLFCIFLHFCTNAKLKTARQIGLTEKINLYHREQLKNIIIQFKRQVKAVSLKRCCCFFVTCLFHDRCHLSIVCLRNCIQQCFLLPFLLAMCAVMLHASLAAQEARIMPIAMAPASRRTMFEVSTNSS